MPAVGLRLHCCQGSKSTITHRGTCFPAPVSEKNLNICRCKYMQIWHAAIADDCCQTRPRVEDSWQQSNVLKASSPPPMVLSPKPRMQCIFHMWRLYTGRPVLLCHVCCAALGVDIGSFRLCCTYVGLKLLINFFCVQIVFPGQADMLRFTRKHLVARSLSKRDLLAKSL